MDGDVSDSRGLYGLAKNGMNVMKDGNQGTYWFAVGKQLQWGTFTVSSDGANPIITCPISFSSTNYIVAFTQETGNASLWADVHITYVSTTQFRWYSGKGTWKYLAIGY